MTATTRTARLICPMSDDTEKHYTAIRTALHKARLVYKDHALSQFAGTRDELLQQIGDILFHSQVDAAIQHQPNPKTCSESLIGNFTVLRKAIETARIVYDRHAREPRTESDYFILEFVGIFIHNRFVNSAGEFDELFDWIDFEVPHDATEH